MGNKSLHIAKKLKRDQLYTTYENIEKELKFYKEQFCDKIVYLNCDTTESNFYKYFCDNFENLKLKKLIVSGIKEDWKTLTDKSKAFKVENFGEKIIEQEIYPDENYNAGDFRSKDCLKLLKEADIICTNPPFSLLRQYIAQLIEYNKKFLIMGNKNAIGYKEIFPLFKENKIRLGATAHSGDMEFLVPKGYNIDAESYRESENGNRYIKTSVVRWFTNLPLKYKPKPLDMLNVFYTPKDYPKYDNYDAINIDKVSKIPCDYPGTMGVPLTFMDKFCPDQFEILGITLGRNEFSKIAWPTVKYINGIQHNEDGSIKNGSNVNGGAVLIADDTKGVYYTADNQPKKLRLVYVRLLIRNKHPENSKQ